MHKHAVLNQLAQAGVAITIAHCAVLLYLWMDMHTIEIKGITERQLSTAEESLTMKLNLKHKAVMGCTFLCGCVLLPCVDGVRPIFQECATLWGLAYPSPHVKACSLWIRS